MWCELRTPILLHLRLAHRVREGDFLIFIRHESLVVELPSLFLQSLDRALDVVQYAQDSAQLCSLALLFGQHAFDAAIGDEPEEGDEDEEGGR